jgi:hypothetical protein
MHDGQGIGAAFQLGAMLGVGRCAGIEKTSLISLTSDERRARPHLSQPYRALCSPASYAQEAAGPLAGCRFFD